MSSQFNFIILFCAGEANLIKPMLSHPIPVTSFICKQDKKSVIFTHTTMGKAKAMERIIHVLLKMFQSIMIRLPETTN
jgi:hypothetical protein